MEESDGFFSKKVTYYKLVFKNFATLVSINQTMFIFLLIGAIGGIYASIIQSNGFFISSNIFTFIGVIIGYKKFPKFAIAYILGFIFLTSVMLRVIFESEKYQIIGIGITLLLVVLTFWYSSIMFQQIKIMNNEKLGKVIAEIAKSIFSPLRNELIEIKSDLISGFYVSSVFQPTKLTFGKYGEDIICHYTKGEIEIYSNSNHSDQKKPIKRLAYRLLKIDDEDLKFILLMLDKNNTEFVKNIVTIQISPDEQTGRSKY